MYPLRQIHVLAPCHFLPLTRPGRPHEDQVIHHRVVIDALHERADAHEVLGVLLLCLQRPLSNRLQVTVETLHSTEVGERTPDELGVRVNENTHSLLVHTCFLVVG